MFLAYNHPGLGYMLSYIYYYGSVMHTYIIWLTQQLVHVIMLSTLFRSLPTGCHFIMPTISGEIMNDSRTVAPVDISPLTLLSSHVSSSTPT